MDATLSCPTCGHYTSLIALGARHDRPYRWRPWVTTLTHLYLCVRCDALVAAQRSQHDRNARIRLIAMPMQSRLSA